MPGWEMTQAGQVTLITEQSGQKGGQLFESSISIQGVGHKYADVSED